MSVSSLSSSPLQKSTSNTTVHSACSSNSQSLEDCADLLQAISPQALLHIATTVRGVPGVPAVFVADEPLSGSYNLVYAVEFADGVKWAARVPKHGTEENFHEAQAATMRGEIELLRLIKKNTSVPLPEIFYYDNTLHNDFGAPFSFSSWLQGSPACNLWHYEDGPTPVHERRHRILDSIAKTMAQLGFLSHSLIGLPAVGHLSQNVFDIMETLPLRGCDEDAEVQYLLSRDTEMEDGEQIPKFFYNRGPYSSIAEYLRALAGERPLQAGARDHFVGERKMLYLIIDAMEMVEKQEGKAPAFTLAHTDLDLQNILIEEDGTLTGILDWDGIRTAPRQLGFAAYPVFLTRDFSPKEYGWWAEDPCFKAHEDSPQALRELRKTYRQMFEKHAGGAAKYTTNSHVYRNVEKACAVRHLRANIMTKLFRICIKEELLKDQSDSDNEDDIESDLHSDDDTDADPVKDESEECPNPTEPQCSQIPVDAPSAPSLEAPYEGDKRLSVGQNSVASTIYEEVAEALSRFGTWLGLPFVTMAHFVKGVVRKKDKRSKDRQNMLESGQLHALAPTDGAGKQNDEPAGVTHSPAQGTRRSTDLEAIIASAQSSDSTKVQEGSENEDTPQQKELRTNGEEDPSQSDTEGEDEEEEEEEDDDDDDARSDDEYSEPPSPTFSEQSLNYGIPPNERYDSFHLDLWESLGRGEVSEEKIDRIRNRFAEVFASDEICEEYGIEDIPFP